LLSLNNIDTIVDLEILVFDWLTPKKIVLLISDGPWAIPMSFQQPYSPRRVKEKAGKNTVKAGIPVSFQFLNKIHKNK